jgi:hypothetical protein
MAIIVEDGTLPTGANSYQTAANVTTFAAARNLTGWAALSSTQQEAALHEAMLYLNNERRYTYRGTRRTATQRNAWPRDDASEYRGPELDNDYISWRLQDAQCLLAIRAGASPGSLQPDLARGGAVQTETVDVISTTYFEGASPETLMSEVDGLLAPLCLTPGTTLPVPYQATPDDAVEFTAGTYSNPSGADDGSAYEP